MKKTERRHEDEAEVRFLEGVRKRCPADDRIWRALAELYTRVGRYEDGLAEDLKLAGMFPREPDVWYNLACSHALLGQVDDAIKALQTAARCGYGNVEWMMEDDDLLSIHSDPRFQELLTQLASCESNDGP